MTEEEFRERIRQAIRDRVEQRRRTVPGSLDVPSEPIDATRRGYRAGYQAIRAVRARSVPRSSEDSTPVMFAPT